MTSGTVKYYCDFDTHNYRRKINAIQDSQVASSLALSVNLKNLNTSEHHKQQIFTNNGSEINYDKDILKKGTYDPPPSPVSSNNQMFPPALSRVPSITGDSPMQHDKNGQQKRISGSKVTESFATRGISCVPPYTRYDQNKSRKNSPIRMRLNQESDYLNTNGLFDGSQVPRQASYVKNERVDIEDFRMEGASSNDFFRNTPHETPS